MVVVLLLYYYSLALCFLAFGVGKGVAPEEPATESQIVYK